MDVSSGSCALMPVYDNVNLRTMTARVRDALR
jgi:hypothetical protein